MVNFPAVLLDHFRCSLCYSALSVGPVCCGPDGAPVCGRCSSSLRDVPNRPLQALMARYSFPCRYTTNGCKQFLPFGDVLHEQECQFQEDVSFEEAFDSIDPLITDDFKCCDKSTSGASRIRGKTRQFLCKVALRCPPISTKLGINITQSGEKQLEGKTPTISGGDGETLK